jgi:hypothetical protein
MNGAWLAAAPPFLVAVACLIVPGLAVVLAGWGWRRVQVFFLAPAISTALIAVAALVAPVVGLSWSILPLAILTAATAGVAFLVGRRVRPEAEPEDTWRLAAVAGIVFASAAVILFAQFALAFSSPDSIAQRFDNIVHLNTVRFAVETGNASPLHVGATSDIPFYPSAWHAVTALAVQATGAGIPVGVNAANLAIVAVVWPASVLALTGALFPRRRSALIGGAALSTAFGAFPALFFNWGVLYPNVLGYAVVPAAVAAVAMLCRSRTAAGLWRESLLLLVVLAGCALAHPNAALAAFAFGGAYAVAYLLVRAIERRSRGAWTTFAITTAACLVAFVGIWSVARTGAEHSKWPPWQNSAQAFGEAVLASPRDYTPTVITVLLLAVGLLAVVRAPRRIPIVAPFLVAITLFVLVSGFPIDSWVRIWLTNPWYSDSNRLAALLPIAAIPVATLGVVAVTDAARALPLPQALRRRTIRVVVAGVGIAILFTVGFGANVRDALYQVREAYAAVPDALLLSPDERALLSRLDEEVPADALLIGSPRTGASLAYALADRDVTELHIFGSPSADEKFLDGHLRDIDTDPAVCRAVGRVGVTHVLDFAGRDVFDDAVAAKTYDGVQGLDATTHLVLIDSQGDAKLFRIDGC